MRKLTLILTDATAHPVYLTAAINSLIQTLPSGTAYCVGIVLIVMMRGRLMQHKGSLARAVLPLIIHLRWGWHRVERVRERGKLLLDGLFDRAYEWCLTQLEVEPVRLVQVPIKGGVEIMRPWPLGFHIWPSLWPQI